MYVWVGIEIEPHTPHAGRQIPQKPTKRYDHRVPGKLRGTPRACAAIPPIMFCAMMMPSGQHPCHRRCVAHRRPGDMKPAGTSSTLCFHAQTFATPSFRSGKCCAVQIKVKRLNVDSRFSQLHYYYVYLAKIVALRTSTLRLHTYYEGVVRRKKVALRGWPVFGSPLRGGETLYSNYCSRGLIKTRLFPTSNSLLCGNTLQKAPSQTFDPWTLFFDKYIDRQI